jgi:hypothetical protein
MTIVKGGSLLVALLVSANAQAVIISSPLGYHTDGLVGTAMSGTSNANETTVTALANQLLAMAAGTTLSLGGVDYQTHNTDDYSGTLSVANALRINTSNGSNIAAGYDYVMGKYDGQNAGWILFYLGGEASSIPSFPYNLWTENSGQYQLSNLTVWRSSTTTKVPEPGSLALLGAALLGVAFTRKRPRRA